MPLLEKVSGVSVPATDRGVWHRLLANRLVAETGDAAGFTALVLLLTRVTDSATQLSTVLAALVVLDAVVTPVCGWAGDRFDRRRLMVISALDGAACYTGMFLAAGNLWPLLALAALSTVFESLWFPASSASIPRLLPGAQLGSVFAVLGQAGTLGGLLGPALVAGIAVVAGVHWALLVNALSFVAAAVLVGTIRRDFGPGGVEPEAQETADEAAEAPASGHVLRRHPVLWSFMGLWAAIQLGTGAMWVLLPLLAEHLGNAELTYSGLNAWSVVATLAGMLLVTRLATRVGVGTLLTGGLVAQALGFAVLAAAAVLLGWPAVGVALAALLVHRGGQALTGASSYELLAECVPDDSRARASSWVDFATIGSFGLGVWMAGPVADAAGLAVLALVSAVLVACSLVAARHLVRVAARHQFASSGT